MVGVAPEGVPDTVFRPTCPPFGSRLQRLTSMQGSKRRREAEVTGYLGICKGTRTMVASLASRQDVRDILQMVTGGDTSECVTRRFNTVEAAEAWVQGDNCSVVVLDDDDEEHDLTGSHSTAAMREEQTPPLSLTIDAARSISFSEAATVEAHSPLQPKGLSHSTDVGFLASTILRRGRHVFITGGAGVGKTTLVHSLYDVHVARGGRADSFVVLAPSGVAAMAAGGVTCHSFLGLTPKDVVHSRDAAGEASRLIKEGVIKAAAVTRIMALSVLCIDEISMVSGIVFSLVIAVIRIVRERAFAAMPQIITIGDFYQLPPVRPRHFPFTNVIDWAFLTPTWTELFGNECVELTVIHRQEDADFAAMLALLRRGVVSAELQAQLLRKVSENKARGEEVGHATLVCARKEAVAKHNDARLQQLALACGGIQSFRSRDTFHLRSVAGRRAGVRALDADLHVPELLKLTVDSRVAFCGAGRAMADVGLVNGTIGVVTSFQSPTGFPVVRFQLASGGTVDVLCEPTDFEVPSICGGVLASRKQLPIHLAWAITVHRCQSISLDHVTLDLSMAFCHGMVYVVVSRVRSLAGLRVVSFDEDRIVVDPVVTSFYDGLRRL